MSSEKNWSSASDEPPGKRAQHSSEGRADPNAGRSRRPAVDGASGKGAPDEGRPKWEREARGPAHEPVGARMRGNALGAKGLWAEAVRWRCAVRDIDPGNWSVSLAGRSEGQTRRHRGVCAPWPDPPSRLGRSLVRGFRPQPDRGNPAVRDDTGGCRKRGHGETGNPPRIPKGRVRKPFAYRARAGILPDDLFTRIRRVAGSVSSVRNVSRRAREVRARAVGDRRKAGTQGRGDTAPAAAGGGR